MGFRSLCTPLQQRNLNYQIILISGEKSRKCLIIGTWDTVINSDGCKKEELEKIENVIVFMKGFIFKKVPHNIPNGAISLIFVILAGI